METKLADFYNKDPAVMAERRPLLEKRRDKKKLARNRINKSHRLRFRKT